MILTPPQNGDDYGLSEVCTGRVTVDQVEGDHETCVSEHQQDIATHISSQLNLIVQQ